MKKLVLVLSALFIIAGIAFGKETRREKRKAREKAKMEEVQQLFDSRNLQFLAQSANPMGGGVIHLTSEYTLDIKKEEVVSYLPFFGVAYTAEYGGGEGGIKFSETARASEWKDTRKGYEIRLEVKAPKDMYNLYLSVSRLGYASLNVNSQNRQPMNFMGIVRAVPAKTE